ncbi:Pao retrotransposon peptidase domain-containing protein [Aphelenchoides avenae]|nr:Pao retrotransposon peptidase domain-containing protein [Aphelenchus avenae]
MPLPTGRLPTKQEFLLAEAEDVYDPVDDYAQQLARLLALLAKAKHDALIHVAADDSSHQAVELLDKLPTVEAYLFDASAYTQHAEAVEDAWLEHLAASGPTTYLAARRRYDRFCQEHGFYANIERGKELVAMLGEVVQQAKTHVQRLRALPGNQKNGAFTIVGKMPTTKLYERPGIPGYSALKGGRPDERHGIPCAPMSKPTLRAATRRRLTSTRRRGRQQPAATDSSQSDNFTGPASRRPYCVFCGRHDHWSSDCPAHDLRARWQLINQRKLCRQCLRAGYLTADCVHADRRCKHCAAHHHAALCPKPHQRFLPSSDVSASPVPGHISVAVAAGGYSPPGSNATAPSEEAHRCHDDRHTTTNPLDTKPLSSCSLPPHAAADAEAHEHRLAKAIASFFQRNSAGSDVMVGFYARSQDDYGQTLYRILKPIEPPCQPQRPVDDIDAHLEVGRVFMVETTVHLLPRDSPLPSSATPDADSRHSTRWSTPSPTWSNDCRVRSGNCHEDSAAPSPKSLESDYNGYGYDRGRTGGPPHSQPTFS